VAGLERRLSLSRGEDPIWYTAGVRCALCVSFGDGETQVVVYGVLGDIGMALAVNALRRMQCVVRATREEGSPDSDMGRCLPLWRRVTLGIHPWSWTEYPYPP